MAASTWGIYGPSLLAIVNAYLSGKSFRAVLLNSSYSLSQSAHDTWSDLSTYQLSTANGYTQNGAAVTLSASQSGLAVTIDATDITWTPGSGETLTAKWVAIVHDADANGTLASTDVVLMVCNLNTSGGSVSAIYPEVATVTINASGAAVFTAAALA